MEWWVQETAQAGGGLHPHPARTSLPTSGGLKTVHVLAAVVTPGGGSGSFHVRRTSHMSVMDSPEATARCGSAVSLH